MHVTFTKLDHPGYAIHVVREPDPAACLHVAARFEETLPHDIAQFLVEREFRLSLGIFGQLAAGGDAGTFWCAPADRTARLAHRAHRLQVTGRGDLGRSHRLTTVCIAAWEIETGRRPPGAPWPARALHDTTDASLAQIRHAGAIFDAASAQWLGLNPGESVLFEWPAALTLRRPMRLRSA
jgi:hypothetical protein